MKSLWVVAGLWRHVGDHCCVTGKAGETLLEDRGYHATTTGQVLYSIKNAKDNISQPRQSDGSTANFSPITATEVNEMQLCSSPYEAALACLVQLVLVNIKTKHKVRFSACLVPRSVVQGGVKVKSRLLCIWCSQLREACHQLTRVLPVLGPTPVSSVLWEKIVTDLSSSADLHCRDSDWESRICFLSYRLDTPVEPGNGYRNNSNLFHTGIVPKHGPGLSKIGVAEAKEAAVVAAGHRGDDVTESCGCHILLAVIGWEHTIECEHLGGGNTNHSVLHVYFSLPYWWI